LKLKEKQLLTIFFIIYFCIEIFMWLTAKGFPAMKDYGESYFTYLAGKNFLNYGLIHTGFIHDFATSSTKAAHPFYYTHFGDFDIFLSYFLQKIGITSIKYHFLIASAVLSAGLFYMYLTIKEFSNKNIAMISLYFSLFLYKSTLIFGLDFHRSWCWILIFAPIYYLKKHEQFPQKKYFEAGIFFYFLMTYFDYVLTAYLTLILIFLKIFGSLKQISAKKLVLYISLGILPSFLLHQAAVIHALGWGIYLTDFKFNFLSRIFGNIPFASLQNFYDQNGIVFWGVNYKVNAVYVFGLTFFSLLKTHGFFLIFALAILFALVFQDKIKKRFNPEYNLYLSFVLAAILISFIFKLNIIQVYLNISPFWVFSIIIGAGILFYSLFWAIKNSFLTKNYKKFAFLLILTMILLGEAGIACSIFSQIAPPKPMPASQILSKYRGKSFVTNGSSTGYINYFTDEWVKLDIDREFLFEKDKLSNAKKYSRPDYYLLIYLEKNPDFSVMKKYFYLKNNFPVQEKGKGYWIFKLDN